MISPTIGNEPPKPMRVPKKITPRFLKERKLGCTNCRHYSETENDFGDGIGICSATFKQGQVARGARAEDKYCGMNGKLFQPLLKKKAPVNDPDESVPTIEELTLDELNDIDITDLDAQTKRRITNAKKKLKE